MNKQVEEIRAEIERLMEWQEPIISDCISFNAGHNAALNKILSFIDSMQNESVSEKKCMFTKDSYTDVDRNVLCEDCGGSIIQYCGVRKSNRTQNGLLKIKVTNRACELYDEEK